MKFGRKPRGLQPDHIHIEIVISTGFGITSPSGVIDFETQRVNH